jgi:hypothetical protein
MAPAVRHRSEPASTEDQGAHHAVRDADLRRRGRLEGPQPAGKVADGGVELQPKHTAKTIRRGTGGAPVVTDGPYVELKEVIGSIVMLECDSIDEAVRVASEWPWSGGMNTIEVRPVMVRE